jgi:uncharacterized protein (UPF0262 family)
MNPYRLTGIILDETSGITRNPQVEQEREVAIHDLLEKNSFHLKSSPGGPYHLTLGVAEGRLILTVNLEYGAPH